MKIIKLGSTSFSIPSINLEIPYVNENHDEIVSTFILSQLFVLMKDGVHTYELVRCNDDSTGHNDVGNNDCDVRDMRMTKVV